MDRKPYLIAVASSDGIVVNNHFGRASKFYIYSVNEKDDIALIEIREVIPVCDSGNHDDNRLQNNLNVLKDCSYILVSRIGYGASNMAEIMGIECFELPGEIEQSIERLIQYKKINQLFN